jgi:hypothetical protein
VSERSPLGLGGGSVKYSWQPSTLTPLLTRSLRRCLQDSGNPTKLVTLLIMQQSHALPCLAPPSPLPSVFSETDWSTDDNVSATTHHHHKHQAAPPATCTTMSPQTQPTAKVKITKMKECPMLTAGTITPLIMQSWTLACKCYMKHVATRPPTSSAMLLRPVNCTLWHGTKLTKPESMPSPSPNSPS